MKLPVLLLAAICLLGPTVLADSSSAVDLVLVAGQSNAVGFDTNPAELPIDLADQDILFWWRCGDPLPDEHDSTSGGWTHLQPQPRGNPIEPRQGRQYGNFHAAAGGFGPEIGFARTLQKREGKRLAIVKVAFSGTGLRTDWNPADEGDGGACFRALVRETKAAIAAAKDRGLTLRPRALVWVQGESDATAQDAPNYEKSLGEMLAALRRELDAPAMIALLGINTEFGGGKNVFVPKIVEAQRGVAASDAHCVYIDTARAAIANNVHFDSAGTLDVGRRFADALLAIETKATPQLIPPDEHKLLVLDSRVIRSAENARLTLGTVVKEPRNPLFVADRPWENALNNLYPNVLWDEEERIFKLWYKCVLADAEVITKMDGPSTVHDVGWYLLYATSKDGLTWDKPALDLHKFDGRGGTNIVARDTPNVGVFKDSHDPDMTRRYKMVYDVGLGKPRMRFSADGIHWGEPVEPKGFGAQNGDTHNNAFWDGRLGKYLWFTKLYLGERTVARLESDDFLQWKNTGLVLRSSVDEGKASQTYCLPVFRYGNIYLGYVMMYHVGQGRTVDCELAWSPDSVTWQRVAPGTPFMPRGAKGSYDSECIYAMAGPPIAQGNELLIFYGGDDFPHTGWKRDCVPCLARLPLDRFASYEPVDTTKPARLETGEIKQIGEPLQLSADAANGSVRVFVLDGGGAVLAESEPITTNVTDAPVRWRRGDWERLKGATLRLRFELNNAKLCALGGVALRDTSLPERPNPLRTKTAAEKTTRRVSFDKDVEGWKGVDAIEHHAEGGVRGGFISVARGNGLLPIALSPATPPATPFAGDWTEIIGGGGATITVFARAPRPGGKVRIEIFAGDIAQWGIETSDLRDDWTKATATLRYAWSDAEARAAGWMPSPVGFSWVDTVTHVGKIVITRTAAGGQERLEIDEVSVTGIN